MTDAIPISQYNESMVWKPDMFKGKVVFVTGGAGTICYRQTEVLVSLGCNACIIGRNETKTLKAVDSLSKVRSDVTVMGFGNVDVRDVKQLAEAVKKTVAKLKKIDFLICGAAGNFIADFNHLSSNAFKSVVDIDLLGSFNTVKACFEELKRSHGSIIFISATLHYYGVPFQSHVGAAKAGIDALSNALAVELGPIGIRSNVIAPGAIGGTEGFDRLVMNKKEFVSKVPLQRTGSVDDIANTTVFLFSDAASYITGTVHIVDGAFWQMGNINSYKHYPELLTKQLLERTSKL